MKYYSTELFPAKKKTSKNNWSALLTHVCIHTFHTHVACVVWLRCLQGAVTAYNLARPRPHPTHTHKVC